MPISLMYMCKHKSWKGMHKNQIGYISGMTEDPFLFKFRLLSHHALCVPHAHRLVFIYSRSRGACQCWHSRGLWFLFSGSLRAAGDSDVHKLTAREKDGWRAYSPGEGDVEVSACAKLYSWRLWEAAMGKLFWSWSR